MWTGDRFGPTWESEGNCLDKPVSMFMLSEIGDVEVLHIREKDPERWRKLKRFNARKVDRAIEVCRGCPVWDKCLEYATEDDRRWSVRGGMEPYGFGDQVSPEKGVQTPEKVKAVARKASEAAREARLRAREEKISKPCVKCGSMDWREYSDGAGRGKYVACSECKRAKRRAQRVQSGSVGS